MSETVWFEQVDTALIALIQSVVKLPDETNKLVSIPVSVRKPEEDFKIESYPSATIFNLSNRLDKFRHFPDIRAVVARDPAHFNMTLEKNAVPYKLTYQIDFWARLISDMNEMTRKWLYYAGSDFNLSVKDLSNITRSCFVQMRGNVVKADLMEGSQRTYHTVVTYEVWVEIDEREQVTAPMVTTLTNTIEKI